MRSDFLTASEPMTLNLELARLCALFAKEKYYFIENFAKIVKKIKVTKVKYSITA